MIYVINSNGFLNLVVSPDERELVDKEFCIINFDIQGIPEEELKEITILQEKNKATIEYHKIVAEEINIKEKK